MLLNRHRKGELAEDTEPKVVSAPSGVSPKQPSPGGVVAILCRCCAWRLCAGHFSVSVHVSGQSRGFPPLCKYRSLYKSVGSASLHKSGRSALYWWDLIPNLVSGPCVPVDVKLCAGYGVHVWGNCTQFQIPVVCSSVWSALGHNAWGKPKCIGSIHPCLSSDNTATVPNFQNKRAFVCSFCDLPRTMQSLGGLVVLQPAQKVQGLFG